MRNCFYDEVTDGIRVTIGFDDIDYTPEESRKLIARFVYALCEDAITLKHKEQA